MTKYLYQYCDNIVGFTIDAFTKYLHPHFLEIIINNVDVGKDK